MKEQSLLSLLSGGRLVEQVCPEATWSCNASAEDARLEDQL
jgi:hypothetical protein